MERTIIKKDSDCRIRPIDINTSKHFWDAFGNMETEESANYIIRYCQQKTGSWSPFYYGEIENFYQTFGYSGFTFNRLIDERYIIKGEDDKYYITVEFVGKCYTASPDVRKYKGLTEENIKK